MMFLQIIDFPRDITLLGIGGLFLLSHLGMSLPWYWLVATLSIAASGAVWLARY